MTRDAWAERTARELIQSAWRPGEDIVERRTRVIAETVEEIERLDARLQHEHDDLAMLAALVVEKLDLECQIAERRLAAAEQILTAEKQRRTLDAKARRAEARGRRATEGPTPGVVSRHLDVDPSAWQALRAHARRDRTTLMVLAGFALTDEAARVAAGELDGSPSSRRRRSPGERPPRPVDRVVRLVITEAAWQHLADAAARCDLTVARYAGEVIEARAHARLARSTVTPTTTADHTRRALTAPCVSAGQRQGDARRSVGEHSHSVRAFGTAVSSAERSGSYGVGSRLQ